jgi:hypothetical protein
MPTPPMEERGAVELITAGAAVVTAIPVVSDGVGKLKDKISKK